VAKRAAPCYSRKLMANDRALEAITRIERAFARIEALASRPAPEPADGAPADYERLKQAHDALRRRVAGAIGQIDHMLETGGAR
jgi:hypothetical protein